MLKKIKRDYPVFISKESVWCDDVGDGGGLPGVLNLFFDLLIISKWKGEDVIICIFL